MSLTLLLSTAMVVILVPNDLVVLKVKATEILNAWSRSQAVYVGVEDW